MIVTETSLSFLGLGLRPPAVSYGVLLKDAQNVQSVASFPWLFIPAIAVILVILALTLGVMELEIWQIRIRRYKYGNQEK